MSAHYDDPQYSYTNYWLNRNYEHQSEVIAIQKLLLNRRFSSIIDLGGGFGRLIPVLSKFTPQPILVEPSAKLRSQAKKYLSDIKRVKIVSGTAEHSHLGEKSQDLVIIVRVLHHIPNLTPVFLELNRIIKPKGLILLEFANSRHIKAYLKSLITGLPILLTPIERRSQANIRRHTIPFVNHHPHTILKLLHQTGFSPLYILSVSNFRSSLFKKIFPVQLILYLEKYFQPLLARFYFGPSIFILAEKSSQTHV